MTKPSETGASITIRLDAYIDHDDQLQVSFVNSKSERIALPPGCSRQDLVPGTGKGPITLEVKNFFQHGAVYEVFGAILEDDGHTIAAYWQPTETGQQYTLPPLSAKNAARIKLLIGALPRCKDAVVPTPLTLQFRPDKSPSLIEIDPRETKIDPKPRDPKHKLVAP